MPLKGLNATKHTGIIILWFYQLGTCPADNREKTLCSKDELDKSITPQIPQTILGCSSRKYLSKF